MSRGSAALIVKSRLKEMLTHVSDNDLLPSPLHSYRLRSDKHLRLDTGESRPLLNEHKYGINQWKSAVVQKCDVKGRLREVIIKSSKALFLDNFSTNFWAQKGEGRFFVVGCAYNWMQLRKFLTSFP